MIPHSCCSEWIILGLLLNDNFEQCAQCTEKPRELFLRARKCRLRTLAAHKGAKYQKPARNWNKKSVKLAVLTYDCNNLMNLEYEVHLFTGNGNVESWF